MTTFHRYGPAALIAIVAMSLAACNGSSKPSAAAASSSSTTAAVAATTSAASPIAAATSAPPAVATTSAATAAPAAPTAATSAPPPAAPSSGGATTSAATRSAAAPPPTGGTGKCTDLTDAAASAALGKATTVKADDGGVSLPGLSICNVTITGEVYPVQLAVDTTKGDALFAADLQVSGIKTISGVGDKAFTSQIGVEALAKGIDIKVTGPAGPVLSGKFDIPTAIAKAMAAALK